MTWIDALPTLELEHSPLFADAEDRQVVRDVHTTLAPVVPSCAIAATKRRMLENTRAAHARDAIDRLPEDGETFHGWMTGHWDAWMAVPRIVELIAPATVRQLNIATLGFNQYTVRTLLEMIDAGKLGTVTLLCSHFYRTHQGDLVATVTNELAKRGGRVAAARSHAKIILFETTDDRCYVWRGSANLRTCGDAEQFDLTRSRELLEYDRGIILGMMDKVGA